MGGSHPPCEELDASSSDDEIFSVADSHDSCFESHPTPLYRHSVMVDTRDPSRVNTSVDILSDEVVPEVVVELPLAKRVTGLFLFLFVPEVGSDP